ncbi:MAG: hypothetical protein JEZ09_01580 [Salinivirgaceae bacterium]|nr:hypothetical protein [Salinivirgaceae bacterium]
MELLFKNTYCEIMQESGSDYIIVKWIGFPKTEMFKEACSNLLILMKSKNIKKLLTDNTNVKLFSVTDQKWLNQEWLPKASEIGYFCSATVSNRDVFVDTAVTNISHKRDASKFIVKRFSNISEAKNWLKNVQPA